MTNIVFLDIALVVIISTILGWLALLGRQPIIIAYIVADQEAEAPGGFTLGQVGPVSEGLMIWVVGLGVLAAVAVWIGAKSS